MKGSNLGELEELILLAVGILYQKAYGVAVMDEIEKQTGRSLNISSVHAVLQRLEDKGLLKSEMSEPTGERGGRRKRIFMLTAAGKRSLEDAKELRNQLFNLIPKVAMQFRGLRFSDSGTFFAVFRRKGVSVNSLFSLLIFNI